LRLFFAKVSLISIVLWQTQSLPSLKKLNITTIFLLFENCFYNMFFIACFVNVFEAESCQNILLLTILFFAYGVSY